MAQLRSFFVGCLWISACVVALGCQSEASESAPATADNAASAAAGEASMNSGAAGSATDDGRTQGAQAGTATAATAGAAATPGTGHGQAGAGGVATLADSGVACDAGAADCGMSAGDTSAAGRNASASEAMDAGGAESAAAGGDANPRLPAVSTTTGQGPFETMQDLSSGPRGDSGVFWPSELGQGGVLHPIFVWGCGGGTTPTTYAELMSTVASYGFVVIAETSGIGDEGAPLTQAIDWMLAENERDGSVFYHKLDAAKVGLGGHSIGSANAFLVADDPRLTTSIHVAGGSLDDSGDINAATSGSGGKRLIHPVAYVCSETDQFGNVEKTERDYEQTTAPAWMTVMSGVDHVGAAREGLPAIIAWLRWQLAGEEERRASFLEPMGEFTSGMYVSKSKNW